MQNSNESNLIIGRGITKKDGKKPGQFQTRLFLDVESAERLMGQLQEAIATQEDGVSLFILEGEGKNGLFGMVAINALEARQEGGNRGAPRGQQRAYNAPPAAQDARPAYTPRNTGYTPKTPGYKR